MTDRVDTGYVDRIVAAIGTKKDQAVLLLNAIQDYYNYLPRTALERLCELTEITPSQAAGVAGFYNRYRLTQSGRHRIKVCIGTACHVKGAENIYRGFKQYLGIAADQDTDTAGLFTVEKVACLGCCMLAPAVRIGTHIYGNVDNRKIPAMLRDFLKSEEAGPVPTSAEPVKHYREEVRLCTCSSCEAAGAGKVYRELIRLVKKQQLAVTITETGCTGVSYRAPLVSCTDSHNNTYHYSQVKTDDVHSLLALHFKPRHLQQVLMNKAAVLLERLYTGEGQDDLVHSRVDFSSLPDSLYWGRQQHIATRFAGEVAPLDFDAYLAHDGFKAFRQVIAAADSNRVINELRTSGLRGRGGAGFPTAAKWESVLKSPGKTRYIICNGDEGDPGAFMDRMLLESFPFRIIEGILIAAFTLQASRGFLYVRSEYPLAIKRVREALRICRENGLTGEQIAGSGFSFRLEVAEGAGAFVCGEETALIAALQGERGTPSRKPPYPAEQGLWGQPTLVNNVETFALIPWIINQGGAAFSLIGTGDGDSTGTKTFSLAGKIRRGGLIEVPMGITLHDIVYDIGGGIQDNKALKAIQVGGPSGGCVPAALVHTPVDFNALRSAGAIMGSGGMVVLDESDCMVDIARYFMSFTQTESCGKCTYCRVGTKRMLEILDALTEGRGKEGDIEKLLHLAESVQELSVCGLGRTAPNPVLSTIKYFRKEYEAHIAGYCPVKKCRALITYRITERCIGCTRCAQHCPSEAIRGEAFSRHIIDPEKCIHCDTCRRVCPETAVVVESGDAS